MEKNSLGKNILVSFTCGAIGASVVIGTCFGVPSVKKYVIGSETGSITDNSNSIVDFNKSFISLEGYSDTAVSVANKVLPSIVGITVKYPVNSIFMNQSGTVEAEGSGIIISENGYILTNNHVINSSSSSSFYEIGEATEVIVFLHDDKTEYKATVVGTDEETDLAVIKIDAENLTAIELGDSDTVQVGEFVMALGNPLGMKSSVTTGIVSALNREITDEDGKTFTLIQTDAAINSGNSGGALVNSEGKLIGINTLKVQETGVEGMGFAIPIKQAEPIYEQLIQYNKVKRPSIGINGREVTEQLAKRYNLVEGIYVTNIQEFSGAEKAGMEIGDIIIKADDQEVKTINELNKIKNTHQIGEELKLTINRDGKEKEIKVKLGEE